MSSYMLNRDCVTQLNMVNSVSESERQAVLRIFQESGNPILVELFSHYLASMNQDIDAGWLAQALRPPEIMEGKLPDKVHEVVDIMGIGGMFAYLNVLYQAHKNKGRHAVVTNPRDIFTFSGWTVHPEEDMDQRLIEMFQTKSMVFNEMKHILGIIRGSAQRALQGLQDRLQGHGGPDVGKPRRADEEREGRPSLFAFRTD